jgi:transcriptional regulator with XRE-family HTH domain
MSNSSAAATLGRASSAKASPVDASRVPNQRSRVAASSSKAADGAELRPSILTPQECRAARKALGWTLIRLAIAADISPTSTWLFENSRVAPFPSTLSALRRALEGAGHEFPSPADDEMRALAAEIERLHTQAAEIAEGDEAEKVLNARDRLVRLMWRKSASTRAAKAAKVKVAVLLLGWRGASEDLSFVHDLARRLLGELAGLISAELEEL